MSHDTRSAPKWGKTTINYALVLAFVAITAVLAVASFT
jgi:hypothetical protein